VVNVLVVSDTPATPPEQPDYLGRDGSPESNRDPGRALTSRVVRHRLLLLALPAWRVAAEQVLGRADPDGLSDGRSRAAGGADLMLMSRRVLQEGPSEVPAD